MQTLAYYLSFPFVRYALVVGVLISLCASLFGVTLVLKRYSFIGDGLSHVAFGAIAIATVLKLSNNTFLVMPITILAAVVLLKSGQNAKLKGDSAIAIFSVSAMSIGYVLMNVFSASSNVAGDVCCTLFGSTSILTLKKEDVWISAVFSVLVVAVFVIFYNRIFTVTFDETFAKASGIKTNAYNFLIAIVIAVIIVLGMNLVGSLLISALVVFPALAAMRLVNNFKGVIIASAVIAVVSALAGMIASIYLSTPTGASIVICNLISYLLACLVGKIKH
ncbi:MAG: metal ABC transporter permease [Lachnospiraceae bacterium]|nr:metal ABC transporter permease [Lachnospiraceae bacterium]